MRPALAFVAVAGGALCAPMVARADDPAPTTLGGIINDLAVAPDGSIRVATESGDGSRWSASEQRVAPDGSVLPTLDLLPAAPLQLFSGAALTPNGAIAVYKTNRKPHPRIRVVSWDLQHQVGKAQTISDPAHAARGFEQVTGPSGAAAVLFAQHLGNGVWEDRIAIRPAGASRFLPGVAVSPGAKSSWGPAKAPGTAEIWSQVVFGPDGSGAVLQQPNGTGGTIDVRRIAADGTLGAPIALGSSEEGVFGSSVAVGPTGTIVVAYSSRAGGHSAVEVTSVAAGSDHAGATNTLSNLADPADDGDTLALTVGAGDHTVLADISVTPAQVRLYDGTPQALTLRSSAPAFPYGDNDLRVVPTADGGATAAWSGSAAAGGPLQVIATHGTAGGVWDAPHSVTPPRQKFGWEALDGLAPLADGGVAIGFSASGDGSSPGDDRSSFVARVHP